MTDAIINAAIELAHSLPAIELAQACNFIFSMGAASGTPGAHKLQQFFANNEMAQAWEDIVFNVGKPERYFKRGNMTDQANVKKFCDTLLQEAAFIWAQSAIQESAKPEPSKFPTVAVHYDTGVEVCIMHPERDNYTLCGADLDFVKSESAAGQVNCIHCLSIVKFSKTHTL